MIEPYYSQEGITIYCGDCREVLPKLDLRADAVITDPPYELGFMGKSWDASGVAFDPETWRCVLDAAKPGAHLLAFGGSRTFHRIAVAIEDAGWEIRDTVMYLYGTGFPKSHDVSKAIDKAAGVDFSSRPASGVGFMGPDGPGGYNVTKNQLTRVGESTDAARQWNGWGSALKPSFEPILVCRKPLDGTIAENVLKHGCGGINIDACRVGTEDDCRRNAAGGDNGLCGTSTFKIRESRVEDQKIASGRWPANIIHDGSQEVVGLFEQFGASASPSQPVKRGVSKLFGIGADGLGIGYGDSGSAARFFYCAKASKSDRGYGNTHATVKPTELMRYLCKLVTPPGGLILDPFCGSGTTAKAAALDGFQCVGIELHAEHCEIIRRRLDEEYIPPEEEGKPPRPKQQVFSFD